MMYHFHLKVVNQNVQMRMLEPLRLVPLRLESLWLPVPLRLAGLLRTALLLWQTALLVTSICLAVNQSLCAC